MWLWPLALRLNKVFIVYTLWDKNTVYTITNTFCICIGKRQLSTQWIITPWVPKWFVISLKEILKWERCLVELWSTLVAFALGYTFPCSLWIWHFSLTVFGRSFLFVACGFDNLFQPSFVLYSPLLPSLSPIPSLYWRAQNVTLALPESHCRFLCTVVVLVRKVKWSQIL